MCVLTCQVSSFHHAQGELDSTLGGVRSHCEKLRGSEELLQQYERLIHGLKELLSLGFDHLAEQPELRSRAQLQRQLSSHTVSLCEGHVIVMLKVSVQRSSEFMKVPT